MGITKGKARFEGNLAARIGGKPLGREKGFFHGEELTVSRAYMRHWRGETDSAPIKPFHLYMQKKRLGKSIAEEGEKRLDCNPGRKGEKKPVLSQTETAFGR